MTAATRQHLAIYIDASERGGAEIATGNLLRELDPGFDVTVIGTDAGIVEWLAEQRPGSGTAVLAPVRSRRDVAALRAHRRAIADLRPDVFHAVLTWPHACRWALLTASTVRGVAVVAAEQLQLPPDGRRAITAKRRLEARLDAHVAVGTRAARQLEQQYGLPAGRVRVIHNGVADTGPVRPVDASPTRRIGTFARLDPIKGIDVLVRALVDVPDTALTIVGRGTARESFERLADELGVAQRIEWAGWTDDPRALLPSFDVFVLPSRAESLPLSIGEAMLAGLPVVATDVGSVREIVDDDVTGLVVAPDDPRALGDALRRVLHDRALATTMGARGRERALAEFTAAAMTRKYEALYAELADRPARRPRLELPPRPSARA